jgi:hypothetical protein
MNTHIAGTLSSLTEGQGPKRGWVGFEGASQRGLDGAKARRRREAAEMASLDGLFRAIVPADDERLEAETARKQRAAARK